MYMAALMITGMSLTACNKQVFDTNLTFNYAMIQLQNGETVEGEVQKWTDFEDGDQIQVKIDDVVYLVHSTNCTLMLK